MASNGGSGPLVPTFHGFVHNSMDALVLFEACLSGKLHHVPRRPHDRERSNLIKSGSIFIYEENASGIKRWTDGVAWSPSRILGNFLIYRELEKPFPPGEKKRAMKRKRSSQLDYNGRRGSDETEAEVNMPPTPPTPNPVTQEVKPDTSSQQENNPDKEMERQLIGSLVDSYGFRPDGLVKKTMSINVNGISHHLVSYYKVEEVKSRTLQRPLSDPVLQGVTIRPELYLKQNFRAPLEENEHYAVDNIGQAHPGVIFQGMYSPAYASLAARQYAPHHHSGMSMYGLHSATGASPTYQSPNATAVNTMYQSSSAPGTSPAYQNPSATGTSTAYQSPSVPGTSSAYQSPSATATSTMYTSVPTTSAWPQPGSVASHYATMPAPYPTTNTYQAQNQHYGSYNYRDPYTHLS